MRRRTKWVGVPVVVVGLALAGGVFLLGRTTPCPPTGPARAVDSTHAQAYTVACYGGPEVMHLQDIPRPTPADTQVEPYVMRVSSGMGAPIEPRIGVDFAGTIEAVGARVKEFRVGDRVFGVANGAFATHVVVREAGVITHIPDSISFEDAAATGVAAFTALQALRDKAHVKAGQRVLINGASGGVGTYAVQIAKIYGAHVTGVASTRNVALVQSLGADRVIDYTTTNFTADSAKYDVILDMVGNQPLRALDGVLAPGGMVVIVGGTSRNPLLGPLTRSALAMLAAPILTGTFANFLAESTKPDVVVLRDWLREGKLRAAIDRRYPFAEVPAAVAYQEAGRSRGKVIVQMP